MSIPPNLAARAVLAALLTAAVTAAPACATRAPGAGPPQPGGDTRLEYLGAAVYDPTSLAVPGSALRMGSLSGLAFDPASGRWLASSDDPSVPRLVWLDISVASGQPVVTARAFLALTASDDAGAKDALTRLDMESLVVLADGTFAATNEGHVDPLGVPHQPAVLHITREGVVTGIARPRSHFTIVPRDPSKGVRHNLGLESLALMPDGRLISGLEQPLVQDGPVSSAHTGGVSRLVEFTPREGGWVPAREWIYQLDATPLAEAYSRPCPDGENGLSELFALDDRHLIAVERACLLGEAGGPAFNPVRLYEVDLAEADDVSSHASLAGVQSRPAAKRLLLDLTTLVPRLPAALARLSNFEGAAVGPPFPGAASTLLLVSDDNFRPSQTLAFLWLQLRPGG